MHMTDFHYDNLYAEGADMYCNLNLCCRSENGFPTETYRQAGKWGGYICDLPENTIRSMLQFVNRTIKPQIIFWTGDNAPHDLWMSSSPSVIQSTINMTNMIKEELAGSNIAFYPTIGNHDVFPVNMQDFSYPNAQPEILGFSSAWADWLGPEALAQFNQWGYYSKWLTYEDGSHIGSTKIIALNTGACNLLNMYLMANKYDPGNQLAWLERELSSLE